MAKIFFVKVIPQGVELKGTACGLFIFLEIGA